MFRTIGDQPSLWESQLPAEVLRLPQELARVDALLDDPAFFAPFALYSGLLARAVGKLVRTARRVQAAGGARAP